VKDFQELEPELAVVEEVDTSVQKICGQISTRDQDNIDDD